MEGFIKAFIRASLVWFAGGVLLGLAAAIHPGWLAYRPAHAHMTVAGFLTMLVFGVGYQLLPRLFGHPLRSRRLAIVHFWLANLGLAGMVGGFLLRPSDWSAGTGVLATGGSLFAAGSMVWVWNLWRTFDAADERQRGREDGGGRRLPTIQE